MIFSSFGFLLYFLPLFLILYYLVKAEYRKAVLFFFSLAFYSFGEGGLVLIIILSSIVNYHLARNIVGKRQLFIAGIIINTLMLVVFKYTSAIGHQLLGISFITFRAIGLLVDVYRTDAPVPDKYIDYGAYIFAFPLISMGPITSYKNSDFRLSIKQLSLDNIEEGLKLLVLGMSAKLLLADRVGILFNDIRTIGFASVSPLLAWAGAFAYSFQLYFDFAGYSLMAKGLMHMMGVAVMDNFNFPYISLSMTDFWRRWHISLGTWFKEYVYIPLGGNRGGRRKTYINLLIVWVLTALWHGLGPNFLLWGLIIYLLILLEKSFLLQHLNQHKVLGHLYMILFIPLSWAVFSVTDTAELTCYVVKLLPFLSYMGIGTALLEGVETIPAESVISLLKDYYYLFICCILFSVPLCKRLYDKHKDNPLIIVLLIGLACLCLYRITVSTANPFMYFDF